MNFFSGMKPFQLILLVIFGAFMILGLVLFAHFHGFSGEDSSIGSVVIWGTLPESKMENVVNAMRNGDPDFQGVQYVEKDERTFDTDLAQSISTGNGPDLILISQEMLVTEKAKLTVIPFSVISERTYLDSYLPIFETYLAEDGTYGIPFAVDPLVMFYNRTALVQGGIATPPSTWEGVTSLAEQLSRAAGGTLAMSTIPFGSYDNVENARAIVSLLLLQSGSTISAVSSSGVHGTLTSGDGTVTPAQSALTFYTQFADPVKTVYSWNSAIPSARQSFLSGSLVFYPGFASELTELKAANPNLDFDMTGIPQPQTAAQRVTYGKAYAFSITASSKNKTGAKTVALSMANPLLSQTMSQSLTLAPATRSSLTASSDDRYAPVYFPQALIAKGWLSPSPSATDSIFSTMIRNITSGSKSVGDALTVANQALDAAL